MATLTVIMPRDVLKRLRKQVEPHGYTAEEFTSSAMQSFVESGNLIGPELERLLLKGLDSPLEEMTEADWKSLRQRIERTGKKRKSRRRT